MSALALERRGRPPGLAFTGNLGARPMSEELQEGVGDFIVLRGEGEGELRVINCHEAIESDPCWEVICRCGEWQALTRSAGAAARWLEAHWGGGCGRR